LSPPSDHRDGEAVAAVFERVVREPGRLDLLVNNATAVPALSLVFSEQQFWEVTVSVWDDLTTVGLRSRSIA
jgi:NAD(P)-dependent dehydrogenase (short-subunit alcohol dehydrogenase family)